MLADNCGLGLLLLPAAVVFRALLDRLQDGTVAVEQFSYQYEGQYRSYYAKRVGDCISEGNVRRVASEHIGIRRLCRTEAGGVRNGTRHYASHCGHLRTRDEVERNGSRSSQHADQYGQQVQLDTSGLETGKETGTDLKADAVNEENQAELFHKVQQVGIEGHIEMTEEYACEQHPGHSQRYALDFIFSQYLADRDYQRQHQYRVGDTSAPRLSAVKK